jgi:hypothetical protein
MTVFWDIAPCSLADIDRRFTGAYCLHHQGEGSDNGGGKYLWNVGKLLPDYPTQHPRRQSSSYSPLWEPEISPRTS